MIRPHVESAASIMRALHGRPYIFGYESRFPIHTFSMIREQSWIRSPSGRGIRMKYTVMILMLSALFGVAACNGDGSSGADADTSSAATAGSSDYSTAYKHRTENKFRPMPSPGSSASRAWPPRSAECG